MTPRGREIQNTFMKRSGFIVFNIFSPGKEIQMLPRSEISVPASPSINDVCILLWFSIGPPKSYAKAFGGQEGGLRQTT